MDSGGGLVERRRGSRRDRLCSVGTAGGSSVGGGRSRALLPPAPRGTSHAASESARTVSPGISTASRPARLLLRAAHIGPGSRDEQPSHVLGRQRGGTRRVQPGRRLHGVRHLGVPRDGVRHDGGLLRGSPLDPTRSPPRLPPRRGHRPPRPAKETAQIQGRTAPRDRRGGKLATAAGAAGGEYSRPVCRIRRTACRTHPSTLLRLLLRVRRCQLRSSEPAGRGLPAVRSRTMKAARSIERSGRSRLPGGRAYPGDARARVDRQAAAGGGSTGGSGRRRRWRPLHHLEPHAVYLGGGQGAMWWTRCRLGSTRGVRQRVDAHRLDPHVELEPEPRRPAVEPGPVERGRVIGTRARRRRSGRCSACPPPPTSFPRRAPGIRP